MLADADTKQRPRRSKNAVALRRLLTALKAGTIGGTQPIAVRRLEAAKMLSVSADTFDRLRAAGAIPAPIRLCGAASSCLLWSRRELEDWVAAGCPPDCDWQVMKRAAANGRR